MSNLACVTCHFNFSNFQRPIENLHNFLKNMEEINLPVYGVELVLPDQEIQTKLLPNWINITIDPEKNILWQKEALLNKAETLVPDHYENIAWIDADIFIDDELWVEKTIKELETHDVIHLFQSALLLDKHRSIFLKIPSEVFAYKNIIFNTKQIKFFGNRDEKYINDVEKSGCIIFGDFKDLSISKRKPISPDFEDLGKCKHAGFAWAMKRSLWKKINGLYDRCIIGGADSAMCKVFLDTDISVYNSNAIGLNADSFQEWALKVKKEKISTSNLNVDIYHFFHGSRENRKYIDRNENTRLFDSSLITNINDLGILEWSDQAPEYLKQDVRDFFNDRLEDE